MAYRTLELTLISAKDLKNVNLFSRMDVYAVVSLPALDPRSKHRIPADREGGRNPNWNSTVRITIPAIDPGPGHVVHILLRSERLLGDRDVGEVRVPLRELLADPAASPAVGPRFLSYQVRRPASGKAKGVLSFSYKLGEPAPPPGAAAVPYPAALKSPGRDVSPYPAAYPPPLTADKAHNAPPDGEPVTAYPPYGYSAGAPQPGYGYPMYGGAAAGYPPPQTGYPQYGYGGAPQPGYGYPPAGYAYGPQQPPVRKNNNFGMGLGAGILGGALGGLLIGDVISSDAAAYDAGYSARV